MPAKRMLSPQFNMLSAGQLVDGQRQGFGRQNYFNKDCYEGGWQLGVRSGVGRLRSAANGQIFVGQYVANKREGPGTLYMVRLGTSACLSRSSGSYCCYVCYAPATPPRVGIWATCLHSIGAAMHAASYSV